MTDSFDSQQIRSIAYELDVAVYYFQHGKCISSGYCLAGVFQMALAIENTETRWRCELLVNSTRRALQELENEAKTPDFAY